MKIAILGAGKQATGALEFLARFPQESGPFDVVLADTSAAQERALVLAQQFKWSEHINSIRIKVCDATQVDHITKVLEDCDLALNSLPYFLAHNATLAAIKSKTSIVDLGGNNSVVEQQFELNDTAKEANVTVVPDCGVAPGMVGLLAADGILNAGMDVVDDVKIRVGGLPANPEEGGPLQYGEFFSIEGLLNEYREPVIRLRNGKVETIDPLTERETWYGGPSVNYVELEAFATSGGCSTLPHTFKNSVKNLDYKTLRYPGHLNALQLLKETDSFNLKTLSELCKPDIHDAIMLRVIVKGRKKDTQSELGYDITRIYALDPKYYYSDRGMRTDYRYSSLRKDDSSYPLITAMMQCTAWPAMIVLLSLPELQQPGVKRQEHLINPLDFIRKLSKTDLHLKIEENRYYS